MRSISVWMLALLLAIAAPCLLSCSTTTPATVAYRTEGTLISSVNTAMMAWRDWVVAGHATQAQVDQVKAAYNQYYNAQMLAKGALEMYLAGGTPESSNRVILVTAAVGSSAASLVTLIESLRQGGGQ